MSMTKTLKLTTPKQNEFNFGAPASINPTRKSMCNCLHKSNPSQTIIFYIWNAKIDNADVSVAVIIIDFDWKTSNGFHNCLTTFVYWKFCSSKMTKRIDILNSIKNNDFDHGRTKRIQFWRSHRYKCLAKFDVQIFAKIRLFTNHCFLDSKCKSRQCWCLRCDQNDRFW